MNYPEAFRLSGVKKLEISTDKGKVEARIFFEKNCLTEVNRIKGPQRIFLYQPFTFGYHFIGQFNNKVVFP